MSTKTPQELNEILKAGMSAHGYWAYLYDEPQFVYSSQDEPPTHTPNGHWVWIPSARDLFYDQMVAPSASVFFRKHKIEVSPKGHQIPLALLRPIENPE